MGISKLDMLMQIKINKNYLVVRNAGFARSRTLENLLQFFDVIASLDLVYARRIYILLGCMGVNE